MDPNNVKRLKAIIVYQKIALQCQWYYMISNDLCIKGQNMISKAVTVNPDRFKGQNIVK